ncbi:MAG: hypothetical protein KatS3mg121_0462 [Gammaproteobacteria bacterium]|nr:MAG: hypothetical protein KatS3mg121_0462 [Gammaproteobacteria bacterium]
MSRVVAVALCACGLSLSVAHADGPRPDSHAPIGVMGDHRHRAGEWMVSYRHMDMHMSGLLAGDETVSPEWVATEVANPNAPPAFMRVVPLSMSMHMHMLGLMWAPSDRLTTMLMLPHLENTMDHRVFQGMMGDTVLGHFTAESRGLGDVKLGALWGLWSAGEDSLHLNLGVSLPTGDTTVEGTVLTPMGQTMRVRLPYPMQLGAGTPLWSAGLTWAALRDAWSWGAQALFDRPSGRNDQGWRPGARSALSSWAAWRPASSLSLSLRLAWLDQEAIEGRDPLITAPSPTADPANAAVRRLDALLGLNWASHGGHRLALEWGRPIDQHADGVAMRVERMVTVGYQYAFE